MTTPIIAAILFVVGVWTPFVHSSCMRAPLVSQFTGEFCDHPHVSTDVIVAYGNPDQYCAFNEMKILPGSKFRLSAPNCLECKCSKQGLVCCGFGFSAGEVEAPDGCVAQNDACRLIFVKKDTPAELCPSTDPLVQSKKHESRQPARHWWLIHTTITA